MHSSFAEIPTSLSLIKNFQPAHRISGDGTPAMFYNVYHTLIPSIADKFEQYFYGAAMIKKDEHDLRVQPATLPNPVMVIYTGHDISFSVESLFPFLSKVPSMQHLITNESGHCIQHQHPELIAGHYPTVRRLT